MHSCSIKRLLLAGFFLCVCLSLITIHFFDDGNYVIRSTIDDLHKYTRHGLTDKSVSGKCDEVQRANVNINCSLIDFLASADPSARSYDPHAVCDELAPQSDILCRMFLRQADLQHMERSTCALKTFGKVPKIVYFVIFGSFEFTFLHYIAFKAAKEKVPASAVYLVGDQHPTSRWWGRLLSDVPGVRFVYREKPSTIGGKNASSIKHISDLVRLQLLYMNGGIYLDADMVVIRDLTPLVEYNLTLGLIDNATGMGNAFIMAKRGLPFIHDWYQEYNNYKAKEYYHNSLLVPRQMWLKDPSKVHMESLRLYRPNWFENDILYKRIDYPWWTNYAVHIWTGDRPKSPEDIYTTNSTIAQIFRHIYYGDSKLQLASTLAGFSEKVKNATKDKT